MNGGISPDNEPDMGDGGDGAPAPSSWDSMGIGACVPIDQISIDGVPPQKGDKVNFSIGGTVEDINGSDALVKIEDINGEAVTDESRGNSETTAQMGNRLRGKAQAATDAQNSLYGG